MPTTPPDPGDEPDAGAGQTILARRVVVTGHVQGVFFRASTRDAARRLGIEGWVRNRRDGRVEAHVQGEPQDVERLLDWIRAGGPPRAHVTDLAVREVAVEDVTGFTVTT